MVKQTMTLDPAAQAYTDDQIVGKVNAAAVAISRAGAIDGAALSAVDADDIAESTTKKYAAVSGADFKKSVDTLDNITEGSTDKHFTGTEKTKLTGIEAGATADQTGGEMRDLIVALSDDTRKILITDPAQGQFKVISVSRDAAGKLKVDYDDQAVP